MSRFSLGTGSIVGAGAIVVLVISTALARGPYTGATSARKTANSAVPEVVAEAPSARPRSSSSASRPGGSLPRASASGAGSSNVEVSPLPGGDVRQAILDLEAKRRVGDIRGQLGVLEKLAEIDVAAFGDNDLQTKLVTLSQQVTLLPGNEPDRLFSLLATKTGTHGPDVLLLLVTNRGGSTASKLAEKLLENPDVLERGSQAMQIAYLLRKAKCEDKKALFERAGEKGDRRTRGQLDELNRDCNRGRRRQPGCCLSKDPALLSALAAMDARNMK